MNIQNIDFISEITERNNAGTVFEDSLLTELHIVHRHFLRQFTDSFVFHLFTLCFENIIDYYSQGPKVIPQSLKSHRLQCIFTFARKLTVPQKANILYFCSHLKVT